MGWGTRASAKRILYRLKSKIPGVLCATAQDSSDAARPAASEANPSRHYAREEPAEFPTFRKTPYRPAMAEKNSTPLQDLELNQTLAKAHVRRTFEGYMVETLSNFDAH